MWVAPLVRRGVALSLAQREVDRLELWKVRQEALGRTPSIQEQTTRLARTLGVPVSAQEVGDALDSQLLAAPVLVAPGARLALERLDERGVRLGIVSNLLHETPAGLRELLRRRGLLKLFDQTILSSERPWAKPRPEPFRLAMTGLGVSHENGVHVGDLLYDVIGAQRAGLRPLLFTGLHRFEPVRLRRLVERIDPTVERLPRWSSLLGQLGLSD